MAGQEVLVAIKANVDELTVEVNALAMLPVASLSKSSLAKVSIDLRDLAKRITVESQKPENATSTVMQALQASFKGLVETVQVLLRDLQVHRKSSLLLITGSDTSNVSTRSLEPDTVPLERAKSLKKPKPLKGTLKKLGEKGLIKTWKTRYFSQAGNRLNYFENENDLSPRSFIPLNEVTKVIRKEKLVFEMHTPNRVYILQALDELDLEEWLIRCNDWIDYFSQLDLQRQAQEPEWQTVQKPNDEERFKLLQATVANQEVQNEILEQQINEVKRHIEEARADQMRKRSEMEQQLTKQIDDRKKNIEVTLNEMRQQNEDLEKEETKSDKIRASIADNMFQSIIKQSELDALELVVRELEDQHHAQEESINSLEQAIEEERRKGNQFSPRKLPSKLQTTMKQVHEQRKLNQQVQTGNATLAKEISNLERTIRAKEEATAAFSKVISDRILRYDTEYKALSAALIEGQGEDLSLLVERDCLKDLYFNALVIQLKLQFELMGKRSQLDIDALYSNIEGLDYNSWPKLIESALLEAADKRS